MKYQCVECKYSTDDRRLWYSHKKSQKHIINSDKATKKTTNDPKTSSNNPQQSSKNGNSKINKCMYCEIEFKQSCHLSRHLKNCFKKQYDNNLLKDEFEKYKINKENELVTKLSEEQLKNENNILKEKIKNYENEKKHYETHIETLKHENQFQKQLIECAGGIINKSMNTMSYLLLNYNNAPQLKELTDYSIISKNTDSLIENLIFYHKKGKIDKYIGDFLVLQYKKDDPKLQSVWSSDTERLNYFIRELTNIPNTIIQEPKDTLKWLIDKKGIKVMNNIIDPLLNYIHDIGVDYINRKDKEINKMETNDALDLLSKMQEIGNINCGIKNKSISKNINKYMAPHFYLNKE